jgi:acyl-CoA synthetase (AMP-forming)/AMP-acid ligase II
MHGGGQWPLFITILNGGVGLFPVSRHFDPHEVLEIVERGRVSTLSIIGDAMGGPIADAILETFIEAPTEAPTEAPIKAPGRYDTSSLVAISSGGALLTDPVRKRLKQALGRIFITGGIGSSEIGSAARETRAFDADSGPRFALDPNVAVLDDAHRRIEAGSDRIGRLARTGHIPLGYYNDAEKTAESFVSDADGVRWVLPGDYARVETDGTITLLGRGSQCINSGGEKIFADEVEHVITQHPSVRHAAVVGVPDAHWMERVVALVELASEVEEAPLFDLAALQAHCRDHLAGYKVPRQLILCAIERTPAGKLDQRWAQQRARAG